MTVRKSISFTDNHETWIKSQVASGQYGSESEVIRELIRERKSREAAIQDIRAKLLAAEQSEFITQTREEILSEFKKEASSNEKI